VLDDLVSNEDARSPSAMDAIRQTIYSGIEPSLDPKKSKLIFNGTPFAKNDVLFEAVESGGWEVNVWPVCDKFPCTEEEFNGAWPERFSYKKVRESYELAKKVGRLSSFNQEYMLRISSDEEKLIHKSDIKWYSRDQLLERKSNFNFYITTDLATSDKQTADFSVISVWAVSHNGEWFWVDGICERQLINLTFDDLFRLAQKYTPMSVGIEISAQQQAYIALLRERQIRDNQFFNFAIDPNSKTEGIRPIINKLSRFNLVVPMFKAGKIFFPVELKETKVVQEFLGEIDLATINGIKGKDDCLDTISMIPSMSAALPSPVARKVKKTDREFWEHGFEDDDVDDYSGISNYLP
jgi:phage terminase large subunit-like protein